MFILYVLIRVRTQPFAPNTVAQKNNRKKLKVVNVCTISINISAVHEKGVEKGCCYTGILMKLEKFF